ncbi:MocR-like pyridoxine biosynthesis transcription factor PdxR [Paracoccus denitrificans]|jgi:GntR family transcriptional regulator/MocR family aminotransferase|uniref:MocR-like pyridoxine biosynthesis transcription factor PdxR n=1 Tax=Paracoccus denitrificans TaxID=266 RepID=UPI0008833D33|nr:PLP-dependent aminotransferase family protein [Paracoccus denitrificans]MCU7430698.1 PLP-dependent aminotransferase family protein [Paracoccus denitrificans]QAR25152.1 PLP-dependent aminotransferase family protein [Paracoccus denitrificans]UPV94026.1 PLP-dependent aminotransferase family protein [Paracoccus denitrificans]WQO33934.1 PLP-dependent aminotransferase family protein [Paracoccus denitrificans]SDJ55598.1 GntR family transcriptional regulator / MocR family aminotransferase [Paracocc
MSDRIPVEMFFLRDSEAGTLQARLAAAIVRAILETRARPGTRLPSSRGLADTLGISRMTVTLVYQELISQGYLETRPRSGIMVAATVPHRRLKVQEPRPHETALDWDNWLADQLPRQRVIRKPANWRDFRYPFIYGQSDPALFDHNAWRDCARRAWGTRDFGELASDFYGADDPMLIDYICSHSLPRRGIQAESDEVLVTLGAQNALFITVELLARGDRLAVTEDPGYPDFAETLRRAHSPTTFLDVDEGGLNPELLPQGTRLVIVTPSHNIPTGATMPLGRRRDLLARAAAHDFLIIEDDYDFEMSYLAPPAPALKSLDRAGRVIYIGSFSKSLFPGLRIGYMVAPAPLIARARALRAIMLRHPPNHLQRITAYFLALGHYDAHIVRLRGALKRRRALMEQALAATGLRIAGAARSGGSSLWIEGPAASDSGILATRLQADSVLIEPGEVFFETPPVPCPFFRLGYSSIREGDIAPGIELIARRVRELDAEQAG